MHLTEGVKVAVGGLAVFIHNDVAVLVGIGFEKVVLKVVLSIYHGKQMPRLIEVHFARHIGYFDRLLQGGKGGSEKARFGLLCCSDIAPTLLRHCSDKNALQKRGKNTAYSGWCKSKKGFTFAGMKESINIAFGQRLSQLRKQRHLTQEELANRCELNHNYIGAVERGEKSPTLNTIQKIATGLQVDILTLLNF